MTPTDGDGVVAEIRNVAQDLKNAEAQVRRLKRTRLLLFKKAVRLGVSTSRLAVAARVEPGTVRQILKRAKVS